MNKLLFITLNFLLLVSQLGLSFSTHYCGEKAVVSQLSIGITILSCSMKQSHSDCSSSESKQAFTKKACCKNELISLSLTETVSDSIFEWFRYSKAVPHNDYQALVCTQENKPINAATIESPPGIRRQFRALYQVYII